MMNDFFKYFIHSEITVNHIYMQKIKRKILYSQILKFYSVFEILTIISTSFSAVLQYMYRFWPNKGDIGFLVNLE